VFSEEIIEELHPANTNLKYFVKNNCWAEKLKSGGGVGLKIRNFAVFRRHLAALLQNRPGIK
jgi:hypothetical protein